MRSHSILRSLPRRPNLARRPLSSYIEGKAFATRDLTLNDFILTQCEERESNLMASFEMEKREFTFGEMNKQAVQIGAGLLALGCKKGDRVAIWGPNQSEWLITVISQWEK